MNYGFKLRKSCIDICTGNSVAVVVDNPDIDVLKVVGISTCPKDASVDVKSICDYISHKDGGFGCVRDVIEQVMRIHNKWI